MKMTYTAYDANPDFAGPCAIAGHEEEEICGRKITAVLRRITSALRSDLLGNSDYTRGDTIWVTLWDQADEQCLGTWTVTL